MTPPPDGPRWRGEPGFFEIWFVVVFDRRAPRAYWFRYTTFAPRSGPARGTLWAAAFEAGRPAVWGKAMAPIEHVHAAVAALDRGVCEGAVEVGGHRVVWRLALERRGAGRRAPRWLERVAAPTRVAHVLGEARVDGEVQVDDARHALAQAVAAEKHLWGTRRVEELYWVYCPTLDGGAAFEATQVRVRRGGPALSPIWLRTGAEPLPWWSVPGLFRARVRPEGRWGLRVQAASARRRVDVLASCDARTLAGYVYRDPSGFDLHVAQSDVATCEVTLRTRPHALARWSSPQRFTGARAAVEFHHPEPLPGVRYVGWDDLAPPEGGS